MISWASRKQKVVSQSSSGSKALANLTTKVTWIKSLLDELRKPILWCDNLSAKVLASNAMMHAWSKRIEIDVHYICGQVLQNQVTTAYVPTTDQIADCLTKPLTHTMFNILRGKLGMTKSPQFERGS